MPTTSDSLSHAVVNVATDATDDLSRPLLPAEVRISVVGSALGAHPGAEVVGRVEAAGDSAQHLLGRMVLVPRLLPCGECDACRRSHVASCAAKQPRPLQPTTHERLPARFLLPLEPPFVSRMPAEEDGWRYAALTDALLAPYTGLVRAGQTPGGLCVVLGGGPRAAATVLVVRALGCHALVVTPSAAERQLLLEPPFAAVAALDPAALSAEALRQAMYEQAKQLGLMTHGHCLIETTGSDAGRARALGTLSAGGTAILLDRATTLEPVASHAMPMPLAAGPAHAAVAMMEEITNQQCQVIGVGPPHPDLLPELLALTERASIDLATLTRAVAPAEVAEVFAQRRAGRGDTLTLPIARYL